MSDEMLLGSQEPTFSWRPPYDDTRGHEVIELAELAGVPLDPYQQNLLLDGCAIDHAPRWWNGQRVVDPWMNFEIEVELSRQNGKSVTFEARALAGLYIFREKLIVYTAHKSETVNEAQERIVDMIHSDGELKAELAPNGVKVGNVDKSIRLKNRQRIKFRTRTKGGGRGLSGDCVILDEDQELDDDAHAALLPLVSARYNPQVWYGGSAGGQDSRVKGRLLRRGERHEESLVVHRWAGSEDDDPADPVVHARLNPSYNTRIPADRIAREQRSLAPGKFAQERLGMGDYPREEGEDWVIPATRWERAEDPESEAASRRVLAIDITRAGDAGAIGLAGLRVDGRRHGQVLEHAYGTRWLAPTIARLRRELRGVIGVAVDPSSPAGALIPELEDLGVTVTTVTRRDMGQACQWMHQACLMNPPDFRHNGGSVLTQALAAATIRETEDLWTWRRPLQGDITALVAVTKAIAGMNKLSAPNGPTTPPRSARQPDPSTRRTGGSDTADLASASF